MTTQEHTIALVKPEDSHVRMEPGRQSRRARVGSEGRQGPEGTKTRVPGSLLPGPKRASWPHTAMGLRLELGLSCWHPGHSGAPTYLPLQSCHCPPAKSFFLFPLFQNTRAFLELQSPHSMLFAWKRFSLPSSASSLYSSFNSHLRPRSSRKASLSCLCSEGPRLPH